MEALLALCKAAPLVTSIEIAAQLLAQLTSYLPESHVQNLAVPLSAADDDGSPWEALTFNLATAVLALGLNHPSLRQHAATTISRYVVDWAEVARSCIKTQMETKGEEDDLAAGAIARIVILAVSLLGFLDAASAHARFWTPNERQHLVQTLRDALSEKYVITLEAALSVIRNSRHTQGELKTWKHYSRRYAANGKPLGAMLLRLGFMQFVVACTSLQVVRPEALDGQDVLEVLLSDVRFEPADDSTRDIPVEQLAEVAADELKLLEEGSDYLQLGSAWQQRLAFAVKANAFKCFLCCSILDEDVADPDALLSRLENTLSDPIQIADEYLASAVFKSMAILSKASPSVASNVGRTLSRIIVQGGLDSNTASVAAQCLASVLKRLPRDATITTLYSLGNVLSAPGAHPERHLSTSPYFDIARTHRSALYIEQNGGSVISLGPSDAEEPSLIYLTTIEAIVCIAWSCREDKIIALALSMLIQKIGRLTLEVDAKIITETAILGVHSAPSELRSLLKLYSKLCHDGLVHDNAVILDAVSFIPPNQRLTVDNSIGYASKASSLPRYQKRIRPLRNLPSPSSRCDCQQRRRPRD
jgi:phosphatidylinositol 4-kinase